MKSMITLFLIVSSAFFKAQTLCGISFDYDAAGNRNVSSSANIPLATQDITYTSFLQPATIAENNFLLTYTYGSDEQRIKGELKQNGNVIETRYYLGGYEKQIVGGVTRHIHYVSAGDGLIAVVVRENGTDTYNYVYTDHLGSILSITNNVGTVTFEQNFDAWGRKRNAADWTYIGAANAPSWLYRGYTCHEHLPQFGLINMNGRIYDPVVGRMLSTDNNVQMSSFSQNYNRYSYALNNPLRYTDPDGEFIHILIGAVVGGVINGIVHRHEPNGFRRGFWIGAGAGAVIAATGGAAAVAYGSGGAMSFGAALVSGFTVSGSALVATASIGVWGGRNIRACRCSIRWAYIGNR